MKRSIFLAIVLVFLMGIGSTVFADVPAEMIGRIDEEFGESRFNDDMQYSYYVKSDGTAAITDLSDEMRTKSVIEFPSEIDGYKVTEITASGASGLTQAIIPEGVKRIRSGAFFGCENLESIDIPESVTEFGAGVFEDCKSLEYIELPKNLKSIPYRTFDECSNLKKIVIPEGVTGIGQAAFWGCYKLYNIVVNSTQLDFVHEDAFVACPSLKAIVVHESARDLDGIKQMYGATYFWGGMATDSNIYKVESDGLAWFLNKSTGCLNVICSEDMPDYTEGTAPWMEYKQYIKSVQVLGADSYVGAYAFSGCDLDSAYLRGVLKIGHNAFKGNPNMYELNVQNVNCLVDGVLNIANQNLTVKGYPGSNMENVALNEGYSFECLDSMHEHERYSFIKRATADIDGYVKRYCTICGLDELEQGIPHPVVTTNWTSRVFDDKPHKMQVEVKDEQGNPIDKQYYYIEQPYINARQAGTYTVNVRMYNEYYNTHIQKTFEVKPKSIAGKKVTVKPFATMYMGMPIEASVNVAGLKDELDYSVKFKNNINAGTATAVITGHGNYTGTINKTYTIKRSIYCDELKIKVVKDAYEYDGKAKKIVFDITDHGGNKMKEGVDYRVEYSSKNRTKIGQNTVNIVFIRNYKGGLGEDFYSLKILPKKPGWIKADLRNVEGGYDDVYLSWGKSKYANGYIVQYKKASEKAYKKYTATTNTSVKINNLADGAKYSFRVMPYAKGKYSKQMHSSAVSVVAETVTLKKIAKPKVVKNGTKAKVSWNNINGETGYQISRSSKQGGTYVVSTIKTTTGKSSTVKAPKGKTYYYKVRAYKVVNGKQVFAPWSEPFKFVRK